MRWLLVQTQWEVCRLCLLGVLARPGFRLAQARLGLGLRLRAAHKCKKREAEKYLGREREAPTLTSSSPIFDGRERE